MLLQDELIAHVLSATGQVFVEPHTIRYTDELVDRTIFSPAVSEFQVFRPPTVWEHLFLPADGWLIPPRVRRVCGLRPLSLYWWPYAAAIALRPVPRMESCKWFITEGVLYAPPGRYELEYISNEGYTISNEVDRYVAYRPHPVEREVKFRLRARMRPGTLTIYIGNDSAVDDGSGNISGSFLSSGTVDYQTNEVSLVLAGSPLDTVDCSFWADKPGVKELDWKDIYFVQLFASKFLTAYSTARQIVRIENMPVDLNVDGLLEYARAAEQAWITNKNEKQSWFKW